MSHRLFAPRRAMLAAVSAVAAATLSLSSVAASQQAPAAAAASSLVLTSPVTNPAPSARLFAPAPSAPVVADTTAPLGAATRAVALRRVSTEAPAPVLRQEGGNRANTALMVVGAAAILVGAAVGDDAGTVLIIGGAGIGLLGLYRFLN